MLPIFIIYQYLYLYKYLYIYYEYCWWKFVLMNVVFCLSRNHHMWLLIHAHMKVKTLILHNLFVDSHMIPVSMHTSRLNQMPCEPWGKLSNQKQQQNKPVCFHLEQIWY